MKIILIQILFLPTVLGQGALPVPGYHIFHKQRCSVTLLVANGIDYIGATTSTDNPLGSAEITTAQHCADDCRTRTGCTAFNWNPTVASYGNGASQYYANHCYPMGACTDVTHLSLNSVIDFAVYLKNENYCGDGFLSDGESDTDCGGLYCPGCADTFNCDANSDCSLNNCWNIGNNPMTGVSPTNKCISCDDGFVNGDETGVSTLTENCGGSCPGCPDDKLESTIDGSCEDDDDCINKCVGNKCISCGDGFVNGGEEDVDCGWIACGTTCDLNESCFNDDDCPTANDGRCLNGICVSCDNDQVDSDESDQLADSSKQCGGKCADKCLGGQNCSNIDDCEVNAVAGGSCTDNSCTSCSDGAKTGDETGVDCGGSSCDGCFGGQGCLTYADCDATMLLCTATDPITNGENGYQYDSPYSCASCSDGVKNLYETDIDCGGPSCGGAQKCQTGKTCEDNDDCKSDHSCTTENTCQLTTASPTTAAPTTAAPTTAAPTTASPTTAAPTTAAPTRAMHLPENWEFPPIAGTGSPHANCIDTLQDEPAMPAFEATLTGDPFTLDYMEDYDPDPPAHGHFSFNMHVTHLLIDPSNGANPNLQYSGWLFFTDAIGNRQYSDAQDCNFDQDASGNRMLSWSNHDDQIDADVASLAFQISKQGEPYIGPGTTGMPYTLPLTCGQHHNAAPIVGGINDGKLGIRHTFAAHYVQCTEVDGYSNAKCESDGWGKVMYNVWRGNEGSDGVYDELFDSIIDTNNDWNGFNPNDIFGSDNDASQFEQWFEDYLLQSGHWTSSQTTGWLDDNYRYPVGGVGGGFPARCRIHSVPVELQYLLPELQDSTDVQFITQFVYSPVVGTDGTIDTMLITGQTDTEFETGSFIPENLLFSSCYHAPRETPYIAHTHDFCVDNELYSVQKNYLYAGMPYRFFFKFWDNPSAGVNGEAESLLNTHFDFTIDDVAFQLEPGTQPDPQNPVILKSWIKSKNCQSGGVNYVCDTIVYNVNDVSSSNYPNESPGEHDVNAFEIYGNMLLDSDDVVFTHSSHCIDEPCVLKLSLNIAIDTTTARRRLTREAIVMIHAPRVKEPDWENADFGNRLDIQITTPSWNTQIIQTTGIQSVQDVQNQIVNCMATAIDANNDPVLSQCNVPPGICTDIEFKNMSGSVSQFLMVVGENEFISVGVQEAIDSCFAESDATPMNPTPAPSENSQNDEILWIILVGIGVTSILVGAAMWIVLKFAPRSRAVNATAETIRLVMIPDTEKGRVDNPLAFGALRYN